MNEILEVLVKAEKGADGGDKKNLTYAINNLGSAMLRQVLSGEEMKDKKGLLELLKTTAKKDSNPVKTCFDDKRFVDSDIVNAFFDLLETKTETKFGAL